MSVTIDRECVEHAQAPRTRFHRAVSLQSRAAMLGAQVGIRSLVAGMDGRARLSLANTGSPVWCRSARPEPIPRDNVEARPGRAGCGAAWATSVRHRRSPVSISSAVADALDGYRWLHETGYGAGDIVVAGDSAGGYLAFMTALSVSAAGLPKPAGAAAMFARYLARAHARITVNGEEGPLASPVAEDLRDMPPVMIHAGVDELLLATPS
jgi:alpha/beta hydrolase fold